MCLGDERMHEVAVCRALIAQVEEVAAARRAHRVRTIKLQLGPLSGVEPQLLQHVYPAASTGTVAEGAELVIEMLPVRIRCRECGAENEAPPNDLACGECGGQRTQLLSGDEMLLASVELSLEKQ